MRIIRLFAICSFVSAFVFLSIGFAQETQDVVYLKNGSVIRGTVIEQVPGKSLKIKTSDGSVFVYTMDEVEKITKEAPAASTMMAGTLKGKTFDVGVTAGYWFSGTVTIEGYDVDKDGAFLLRVFGDAYIIPQLAFGGYFNFSPYSEQGVDITAFEIGGAIKPRFFLAPDFVIKPGLNLGYRFTTSDIDVAEISAFGLNLSVEFQKAMPGYMLFGELGFLSQPAGGNSDVEVTFAPIFYVGAGIGF